MNQNDRDPAGQFACLRLAQGFDLLGDILPVDRQVGAGVAGIAQCARLAIGLQRQISVIFAIGHATSTAEP